MWFSAIKLALNAGTHIYKKRQETKMLMADAQRTHAQRMASGEIEYKQAVMQNNQQGWKDEFVLILVSAPVMLLIWSIFSDDPAIMKKVEMFFEYFALQLVYTQSHHLPFVVREFFEHQPLTF